MKTIMLSNHKLEVSQYSNYLAKIRIVDYSRRYKSWSLHAGHGL